MIRKSLHELNNDYKRIKLPITPEKQRIKILEVECQDKPKKLILTPPTTPVKSTIIHDNVYTKAKSLFQRGYNLTNDDRDCLMGREDEGDEINEFINKTVGLNYSDNLYITGPPGCGKTAQLDISLKKFGENNIFNDHKLITIKSNKCKIIKLNCMSLFNPNDIFNNILNQLNQPHGTKLSDFLMQPQQYQSIMIILDEIDSLLTKDFSILSELFNLSNKKNHKRFTTKLIMIGISNSIDLTNKILPVLSRNNIEPKIVNFKPYSFDKIKTIITQKLKSLIEVDKENTNENFIPIVNASAILLCCKKISSVTGDLRKAFDTIIKSIELIELELISQNININDLTFLNAPRIEINQMAKICNLNYNNSILFKLNHLQRKILINLFNYIKNANNLCNINNFFDYYILNNTIKIKKSDFQEILVNFDSLSIIHLNDTKFGKIIQIKVDYQEFKTSIKHVESLYRELQ